MTAFNQEVINLTFRPTENKSYTDTYTFTGDVILTALEIDVSGEAILSSYDILDSNGTTWDLISFMMFSTYDKILEIWQRNKHISKTQKKAFSAPIDTPLFTPVLSDEDKRLIKNTATNLTPPWK